MTPPSVAIALIGFAVAAVTAISVAAYLSVRLQRERTLRVETSLVARALAAVRDARTFSGGLTATAALLCEEWGARACIIAVEEIEQAGDEPQRWLFRYSSSERSGHLVDVPPSQRNTCFPPWPERPSATSCETRVESAWRIRWSLEGASRVPAGSGRLLARTCEQVTPALYNLSLVRRLRKHAISEERSRIGRELHDSVIQSLIGLEMGIAALTASPHSWTDLAECTTHVRETLRDEIANMRDLMHSFRPLDVSGATLPVYLAELADRFHRDTGIATTFVCDTSTDRLPRRWCADVARVAQEALVNVRKHSGATSVVMRLAGDEKGVTLRVDDNGRGFAFAGRLDNAALWHQRTGPLVIKERARAIGASVAVESTPGHGASVEMSLSYAF